MTETRLAHGVRLSSSILILLVLVSCSSQSYKLIHPQSGRTAGCSASGRAIGVSIADGVIGGCARAYEDRGHLPMERLHPDERASLERRGLLPKNKLLAIS